MNTPTGMKELNLGQIVLFVGSLEFILL